MNDWAKLLNLAQFHGMIPLLYTRLKETVWELLPKDVQETLEIAHRMNAIHALSLTDELLRLVSLLQQQDIFALPYKGPVLAAQLYGDIAMRQFVDLDVVINKTDWTTVNALLIKNDWAPVHQLPATQENLYQRTYKDHGYYLLAKNILLELHWAFSDPHFGFPLSVDAVSQQTTQIEINQQCVPIPVVEDLLLLLCFHGAKHKWERISWLADIAQLIAISPQLNWDMFIAQARKFGCLRIVNLSLCLAQTLAKVSLPDKLWQQIQADKKAVALAQELTTSLMRGISAEISLWQSISFHLQMRERWRDRLLYCYGLIFRTTPEDWVMLPFVLPAGFSILYYPARLIRLLRKHLLRHNP